MTAPLKPKLLKESTFQSLLTANQSQVTALNDIKDALGTFNSHMSAWAGALSSLTTGDKSSLVAAINWVLDKESIHEQNAAMHDVYEYLDSVSTAETGAFIHNSLARGVSLGSEPTADQFARIADRTYKGLWLANYWNGKSVTFNYLVPTKDSSGGAIQGDDTTASATISPVMRIGDHDYLKRAGDVSFGPGHLSIIPDASLYRAPMNKKTSAGANSTAGAYALSDMRTKYLAAAVSIFESFFGASHVLSYRDYLQNAVTNGKASGGAWYDCKIELMDERQVYGGLVFDSGSPDGSNIPNRYTIAMKQFNLFRVAPWMISNRKYYWLRNVVSALNFAFVNDNGHADHYYASIPWFVCPAAHIG